MDLIQTSIWIPGSQSRLNRHGRRIGSEWALLGEFGRGVEVWCIGLKGSCHGHLERLIHYGCECGRVDLHHHGLRRSTVPGSNVVGYQGSLVKGTGGGGCRGHTTAETKRRCQVFGSQPWQYNHPLRTRNSRLEEEMTSRDY